MKKPKEEREYNKVCKWQKIYNKLKIITIVVARLPVLCSRPPRMEKPNEENGGCPSAVRPLRLPVWGRMSRTVRIFDDEWEFKSLELVDEPWMLLQSVILIHVKTWTVILYRDNAELCYNVLSVPLNRRLSDMMWRLFILYYIGSCRFLPNLLSPNEMWNEIENLVFNITIDMVKWMLRARATLKLETFFHDHFQFADGIASKNSTSRVEFIVTPTRLRHEYDAIKKAKINFLSFILLYGIFFRRKKSERAFTHLSSEETYNRHRTQQFISRFVKSWIER